MLTNHHECKDLASVSSFAWIMVAIFRKSEVRQFGLLTIQRIFFQFFFLFAAIDYLCEKLERLPNPQVRPKFEEVKCTVYFPRNFRESLRRVDIFCTVLGVCYLLGEENNFFVHVFFLYDEKPIRTTIKFIYFPFDKKLDLVLKSFRTAITFI